MNYWKRNDVGAFLFYFVNLCRNYLLNEDARTNLETYNRDSDARLFRYCRDTACGMCNAGRTGGIHLQETGIDTRGNREQEIRFPRRGVAHLHYFFSYG